jgi:hypothetical protein
MAIRAICPVDAYAAFLPLPKPVDYSNPFEGSPKDQYEARKKLFDDAEASLQSAYPYA